MLLLSVRRLASLLQQSNNIVFFTGEGLAREVGIRDFKRKYELLERVNSKDVFTYQSFKKNPLEFYRFCLENIYKYRDSEPGEAHLAMARLEELYPEKEITIITQNIYGLHQKAGSSKVTELHGNVETLRCSYCYQTFSSSYLDAAPGVPKCSCGHILRPDVVLFYEDIPLEEFFQAMEAIKQADLIIVAGSALKIFPANGLLKERKDHVPLVIINNCPTEFDFKASLLFHQNSGPILRTALRHMLIRAIN